MSLRLKILFKSIFDGLCIFRRTVYILTGFMTFSFYKIDKNLYSFFTIKVKCLDSKILNDINSFRNNFE